MDDDREKSIVEKTVQTVKDIASTVSDAAKHAMEPEPLKPGEEAVTYSRMAGDGPHDAAVSGNPASKEINFEESAKNDR